jgi:branched-chain amino acid transport system ATP-binding protein
MLTVSGLTKKFGGFTAVNGISFELARGEILGLIGPNGSGKSTTFNVIAGLYAPTSGSVTLDGREIGGRPPTRSASSGWRAPSRSRARSASCRSSRTPRSPRITARPSR